MLVDHPKNPTSLVLTKEGLPSYTMSEVSEQVKNKKVVWIIVDERVYDVTLWGNHPGGDIVLRNMAGKDCTEVFENYHQQASMPRTMLRLFHIGNVSDRPAYVHVKHFRALRQELQKRGMFKVNTSYYIKLYLWLASIFLCSLYLSLATGEHSLSRHMLGAVLLGLFWQQIAGLGHDLGHSNVSRQSHRDHMVGSVIGCCTSGISTAWWKRNHNTHHIVCNSVENDPDIQHMPSFAVSEHVIQRPYWSSFYRKWFRLDSTARVLVGYQHFLFFPLMLVARFNMYAQSWRFLLDQNARTGFRKYEMCSLIIFIWWYLGVALSMKTWYESVAWVLISHGTTGILHIQIVVSHWAMEMYRGQAYNDGSDDWYRLQLKTTLNIDCPWWMDWAHLGLQFQIEHHLFPTLPRHNLRAASKLVHAVCRQHGISYHHHSFTDALRMTIKVLSETAAMARSGKYATNLLVDALNADG